GVRRAIDITFKVKQRNKDRRIFTLGQIIHNPQVIDALTKRGIGIVHSIEDPQLRPGDIAIVRAHGISPDKKKALTERGVEVIDAACPMVLKLHSVIKKACRTADLIAIVGDKDHPEMDAHMGVAKGKGTIVEKLEDAKRLPRVKRMAVVAQTTFDVALYREIVEVLKEKAEILDVSDTICRSTVDRQTEVRELARDHDTFIVIGGRNSANTNRLAEIAAKENRHVIKVESPEQLRDIDRSRMKRVAVIAGASTPHWVIEECIEELRSAHPASTIETTVLDTLAESPLLPSLGALGVAMAAFVFSGQPYRWDVLTAVFFLAFSSTAHTKRWRQWPTWAISTGIALSLSLVVSGLPGGLMFVAISLLRPLVDVMDTAEYIKSVIGGLTFILISIVVPLALTQAAPTPGTGLLAAYTLTHYLGAEILIGLKNMEKDAIMGTMSLARYISEDRAVTLMEYTIMGLALMLFLSFPLKVAPALAYGLLPSLFFLAKGIDFHHDQRIFDNRMYTIYVMALWAIIPAMGLLWLATMM
ncbi:MAG TPA: 4-hydroxy-3-methylbut-2-enyl diphosphate reductase, partial [Deltaproteobacteria bacterium]|nr:4-hydroxy-3-methylbut-2-enyl diphosphate reductase [Deltaproteobacteria bacterium]